MYDLRKDPSNKLWRILPRYIENNSPTDLGIVRFAFDFAPYLIKDWVPQYGVAPWARKALYTYFKWDPSMTKEDRCHVIATFRDGTKTTWFSYFVPLYEILVGQYGIYTNNVLFPEVDFQVLKGKTGPESKKRLMNISSSLNNEKIIEYFGELKPTIKEIRKKNAKDTVDLLILSNKYILMAQGIDQPIRGANIFQMRPKKITYDDPENKDNTKTETSRAYNRQEVIEDAFGAITDFGSIVYIGNKVHVDDTIGKLLANPNWKKQFYTWSYTDKNGVERSSWPKRHTIEYIHKRKEFFKTQPEMGGLAAFYKEYYNKIVSETDYKLKTIKAKYVHMHGVNWVVVNTPSGPEYRNVYVVVANDPAISDSKKSSDAVTLVLAQDAQARRYIIDIEKGKFDLEDVMRDDVDIKPILARTPEELAMVKKKGSIGNNCRMALKYHANAVSIEVEGQQLTFFLGTQRKLRELGIILPMQRATTGGLSKAPKLREMPLLYFEAGLYYIFEDCPHKRAYELEVETFPWSKLDLLDATNIAEQALQKPNQIKMTLFGIADENKEQEAFEQSRFSRNIDPDQRVEPWIVN